jgi:hypothetical protein
MYKLTSENDQNRSIRVGNPFVGRDVRRRLQSASVESKEGRATTMFNTFYKTFMSVRIIERERERDGDACARGWFVLFFALSLSPSLEVGSFSLIRVTNPTRRYACVNLA